MNKMNINTALFFSVTVRGNINPSNTANEFNGTIVQRIDVHIKTKISMLNRYTSIGAGIFEY